MDELINPTIFFPFFRNANIPNLSGSFSNGIRRWSHKGVGHGREQPPSHLSPTNGGWNPHEDWSYRLSECGHWTSLRILCRRRQSGRMFQGLRYQGEYWRWVNLYIEVLSNKYTLIPTANYISAFISHIILFYHNYNLLFFVYQSTHRYIVYQDDQKARKAALKAKKEAKKEKQEAEKCRELTEREKRALAAERRILKSVDDTASRPVFLRCQQCSTDISGLVPYSYYNFKFCTMDCLKEHKKANS